MARHGFPLSRRLRQPQEFDAVFKRADYRVGSKACLLLASRRDGGAHRLGLVVGKKSVPKAVNRNRLKRLVREAFRQCDLGAQGLDLVFLARGRGLSGAAWSQAVATAFSGMRRKLAEANRD